MKEKTAKVKNKLWKFGYSVKDVSDIKSIGYELLVANKFRVKIVTKKPKTIPKICDVCAIIQGDEINFVGKGMIEIGSPYPIFGKVENNKK